MTKKESKLLIDKIIEAMKAGVAKVYEDARTNGIELVISTKAGEVKKIKVS